SRRGPVVDLASTIGQRQPRVRATENGDRARPSRYLSSGLQSAELRSGSWRSGVRRTRGHVFRATASPPRWKSSSGRIVTKPAQRGNQKYGGFRQQYSRVARKLRPLGRKHEGILAWRCWLPTRR